MHISSKNLKTLHPQLYCDNWNVCIIRLKQLSERSVSLEIINTLESLKSL